MALRFLLRHPHHELETSPVQMDWRGSGSITMGYVHVDDDCLVPCGLDEGPGWTSPPYHRKPLISRFAPLLFPELSLLLLLLTVLFE
jgi:hypothetical protein